MAVSSANISGLPAALTCDEAIDQLGASVSVYLDEPIYKSVKKAAIDEDKHVMDLMAEIITAWVEKNTDNSGE